MTFKSAVKQTPDISQAWCKGLQALRSQDRVHVKTQNPRRLCGSVDLDTTLKSGYPNDPRWDYAVGHKPANLHEEVVYWVEIHPANPGAVEEVLAKLRWLQNWLSEQAPQLNGMRREFIWISSGATTFTLSSPQRKQFAERGLQHKGRLFSVPENAPY